MATKELIHNIKITLPLIALCLPLSAKYYATAENGCPYETYIRIDGRCIDISAAGLQNITKELDTPNVEEVSKEIEEVNQELEELSAEVADLCMEEQPETDTQVEILAEMCHY